MTSLSKGLSRIFRVLLTLREEAYFTPVTTGIGASFECQNRQAKIFFHEDNGKAQNSLEKWQKCVKSIHTVQMRLLVLGRKLR